MPTPNPAVEPPPRRAVAGLFLRLFLPLAAVIVAVGAWMTHTLVEDEARRQLEEAAHRAEIGATLFARQMKRPVQHLASLANESAIRIAVGRPEAPQLDAMATAFHSLLMRNREMDQVAWIDRSGQERVRIDRGAAGPVRLPSAALHDRSDREEFRAATDLPPGGLYVSAIDLSGEPGQAESPYKPTLRLATPALDEAGGRNGVLVLHLLMEPFLDTATLQGVSGVGEISVLNARGYWLRAADPADKAGEWAFEFGRATTLESRFPRLWERVAAEEEGRRWDADGLWAWQRVASPVPGSADSPWLVLARQPPEMLSAFRAAAWAKAGGAVLGLLVLLGLLCRNLALRRAQRDEALVDLGRSQADAQALRQHVAEAQRHEAVSALLAAIVDSSDDAIFSTGPDGLITSWNPGAERLMGYTADEAIGKSLAMLCPHGSEAAALAESDARRGEVVHRAEAMLCHKAGHLVEVAVTWSPIRKRDGKVVGSSCTVYDIREQKRVAAELAGYRDHLETLVSQRTADLAAAKAVVEEREIFIRAITDNLPGMVSYWDRDLRCRFANWAYREWFGRSPERMLGIRMQELLGDELFAQCRPHVQEAWRGTPQHFQRTMVKADGTTGHSMVHLIPDRRGGEVLGIFVMATDVTPLKEAELRLRETNADLSNALAEAGVATQAKNAFLANMSHEIRTPMNAILGMAYLLEKADLPEDAARLAHRIQNAGRSLLTILNDILDFSRIESGELALEPKAFALDEIFDNLAAIMADAASDKDIELAITPPADLGPLRGDAVRLGQVLINLTSNAIKFTERGHVEVSAEVLSQTEQEVRLRFAVRDTGIGIPLAKQKDIFNPFTQADTSTTRRSGGTGLGLAISHRLVTLMGGEIGMDSRPGQGSEFWFTLRLPRCSQGEAPVPGPALDVLVADDSPTALDALCATALSVGWKPETVPSGEAAVFHVLDRLARHGSREIIVLDWKMPGLDGLAAAQAIREALHGQPWPILLMVPAHSRDEVAALPGAEAVDAFIDKPVTPSSLYDAVMRAQGHRQVDASRVAAEERLAGLRILVVDDSEINREVARSIFAGEGARVEVAEDGLQGLELLQSRPADFDIVLMDVQMPVMDGHEATREIRRNAALAALPVVAVTAGAFQSQKDSALAAGMDDFVAKPFDVEATIALICKLTGRKVQPAPVPAAAASPATPPDAAPAGQEGAAGYPGLDIDRALSVWKDPEMYRHFLRQFARDYGGCIAVLRGDEPAAAEALAHRLKGAAGTLRVTAVAECASQLNQAMRKGEPTAVLVEELQAALDVALASIRRYAPETATAG